MDLLLKYSDTVIKEIMQTIAKSQKKLDRARNREIKLHEESNRHQDNYWKAQRTIEVEIAFIDKLYDELYQMDTDTNWTDKLHQDRFEFVNQKYSGIYEEYQFRYRS